MSTSVSSEEANIVTEIKTPEEAISGSPEEAFDSSSSSYKVSTAKSKSFFNKDTQFSSGKYEGNCYNASVDAIIAK